MQRADDALGEIRDGTDGTDGGAESAEAWAARASRVEAALQTLERAHKALLIPGQSAALEVRWAALVAPTRRLLAEMGELVSGGVRGRFVWVDGPLVHKALTVLASFFWLASGLAVILGANAAKDRWGTLIIDLPLLLRNRPSFHRDFSRYKTS